MLESTSGITFTDEATLAEFVNLYAANSITLDNLPVRLFGNNSFASSSVIRMNVRGTLRYLPPDWIVPEGVTTVNMSLNAPLWSPPIGLDADGYPVFSLTSASGLEFTSEATVST